MKFLMFLLFLIAMASSAIIAIFYAISRFLGSSTSSDPNSKAWKNTVDQLRAQLNSMGGNNLIPWEKETLSLLSLNRMAVKKPGFFKNSRQGIFTTIYQEPVFAYVSQGNANNSITLARTSDREFVFRRKGKQTDVWVNSQLLGAYIDGNLLASGKSSKLLAQVSNQQDTDQRAVLLNNSTAAAITNPGRSSSPNPRAFSLLRDVSPEEENMLLTMLMEQTR